MEHVLHHTVLGFCWWDLPALIILIGVLVLLYVRHRKLKKREKEYEDELARIYLNNSIEP